MTRVPGSLAAVALCLLAQDANAAPTKAECVAAHEIGQRLWKADKLREAVSQMERCATEECPAVISSECTAWREQAMAELPTVSVQAIGPDGHSVVLRSILIDGELVKSPDSHPVDPGQHTAIVTTREGLSAATVFVAKRGDRASPVVLRIAEHSAPRSSAAPAAPPVLPPVQVRYVPAQTRVSPSATPWAWGLGVTGAAAMASFSWFGLSGRIKERDMDGDCAPFCPASRVDSMHRDYVIADVSLGVGLVALGLSVWIIHAFREPVGFDSGGMKVAF